MLQPSMLGNSGLMLSMQSLSRVPACSGRGRGAVAMTCLAVPRLELAFLSVLGNDEPVADHVDPQASSCARRSNLAAN